VGFGCVLAPRLAAVPGAVGHHRDAGLGVSVPVVVSIFEVDVHVDAAAATAGAPGICCDWHARLLTCSVISSGFPRLHPDPTAPLFVATSFDACFNFFAPLLL